VQGSHWLKQRKQSQRYLLIGVAISIDTVLLCLMLHWLSVGECEDVVFDKHTAVLLPITDEGCCFSDMRKELFRPLWRAWLWRQRLSMFKYLLVWKVDFHRIGDSWRSAVPDQDEA
jgi:hypothetical protein